VGGHGTINFRKEDNMNNSNPILGVIAKTGQNYSVQYAPKQNENSKEYSSLSGYDLSVFRGCPDNMPVIDFRAVDIGLFFDKVLPLDSPEYGGDLQNYLDAARSAGAIITKKSNI
jgi:hypothetical protein